MMDVHCRDTDKPTVIELFTKYLPFKTVFLFFCTFRLHLAAFFSGLDCNWLVMTAERGRPTEVSYSLTNHVRRTRL